MMWVWDSALRDKVGNLWLACAIGDPALSPRSPLHNPTFSSQILESCAKLPPNLRKILESSGVVRKLTFSVIASGVSRAAIHFKKVDSMDCHDFASAKSRNDGGLFFQQDSRYCGTPKEAEMVFFKCRSLKTQAAGFADDFVGFQAVGAGILLGVNEQARAVESTIYRKKPTAQTKQRRLNGQSTH